LVARLEERKLTPEQVQGLQEFAAEIAKKLELADGNFADRKQVVEMLDVHGTLAIVDDLKVLDAQCMLGDKKLPIVNTNSPVRAGRTPASRRLNCGSARNHTLRCARLTPAPPQARVSPGRGHCPPPTSPACEMV
jgi:hypothetical protein